MIWSFSDHSSCTYGAEHTVRVLQSTSIELRSPLIWVSHGLVCPWEAWNVSQGYALSIVFVMVGCDTGTDGRDDDDATHSAAAAAATRPDVKRAYAPVKYCERLVSFPDVTPLTDFQFLPSRFESEARSSHSDSNSEGLEVCSNVWYISLERGGVRVERGVFGPNMEDLRALRGQ